MVLGTLGGARGGIVAPSWLKVEKKKHEKRDFEDPPPRTQFGDENPRKTLT